MKKLFMVFLVVSFFSSGAVAFALEYTITDLGTLGGSNSFARGINNAGQVSGYSEAGGDHIAFLWEPGSMAGLIPEGADISRTFGGINDDGDMVGQTRGYFGGTVTIWLNFLYSEGSAINLGNPGTGNIEAWDINNAGDIAGVYNNGPYTDTVAFLYSGGTYTTLPTLGGNYTHATGINESGQIVGVSNDRAFLYFDGTMDDIGDLGGNSAVARDINEAGQIAGYSTTDSNVYHAFLYSDSTIIDLGTLGGQSSAIRLNNLGQVVGGSVVANGDTHAFLYSNGEMSDINDFVISDMDAWQYLKYAYDINDQGQIVGQGIMADGSEHGFLLTPLNTDGDGDGVPDGEDNCPATFNPDQANNDGDGSGKACDACPNDPNRTDPCGVIIDDVDFIGDNRPDSFKLLVILFVKDATGPVKVEYSVDGSAYIEMEDTGGWGGYWGYETRVTDDFIDKSPEYFNGKEFTFRAKDDVGTNTQTSTPYGISAVPELYGFKEINNGPYPEISWKHDSTDPLMDYYVVRVINPAGDLLWGTGTPGNPPHLPYSPEASYDFDGKYQFDPGVEYFFRIEARDFIDNYKQLNNVTNNFTNAVWNRYRSHYFYQDSDGDGNNLADDKETAYDDLYALSVEGCGKKNNHEIEKALKHLGKSLNIDLWVDATHLETKHGHKVFDEEKKAVKNLMKVVKRGNACAEDAETAIDLMIGVDQLLAQTAIDEAAALCDNNKCRKEIDKAIKDMEKAEKSMDEGKPDRSIDHYKKAWKHAQKDIKKSVNSKDDDDSDSNDDE